MRSWELDKVCPGFQADSLRSGDVVFACHGPVTLLSQVEKLKQKQQEETGLLQKDTENLWGEFSLLPRVYPSLHRAGPLVQFSFTFNTYFMFGTCEGYKVEKNASFPQGMNHLVEEYDKDIILSFICSFVHSSLHSFSQLLET